MIKAIFLDLGQTLIDDASYSEIEREFELPFWSKHGFNGSLEQFKQIKHKTRAEFLQTAFRNEKGRYLWDTIMAKNLGIAPTREIVTEGRELAKEYYTKKSALREGAVELLEYLKGKNIRTIMVSNQWSDMANSVIDALGIRRYFDYIIISEDVGAVKSELKPFTVALEKAGVEPYECLMVGDDKEDAFCKSLGIRFAWIDVFNDGRKIDCDYRIEQLLDLKDVIRLIG